MSSDQKTAILVIRLVATLWIAFFGFAWVIYGIEVLFGIEVGRYLAHTLLGNITCVFGGLLVLSGGNDRPLAQSWSGRVGLTQAL